MTRRRPDLLDWVAALATFGSVLALVLVGLTAVLRVLGVPI